MTTDVDIVVKLRDMAHVHIPGLREEAAGEIERLRQVCAEAYQLAGALDAPVEALDNLAAAMMGQPLPHATFLPVLVGGESVNARLVEALKNVTVHLIAAHSLLERGGKKAAASDTMFSIMLSDYMRAIEQGRAALAEVWPKQECCEVCGGDCAGANPEPVFCPNSKE